MKVSEVFVVICLYLLSNGCFGQTRMTSLKWTPTQAKWCEDVLKLLLDNGMEKPPQQTLEDIIEKSKHFPVKFPVDTVRCKFLKDHVPQDVLERNINSVYPIVHYKVLELFCKFILLKRNHGSEIEKEFYKNMTLDKFVDRLLTKRAVTFLGLLDKYWLINGESGQGNWENIGTSEEQGPLLLEQCLSYDELKCAVFLSVSSYTYFVNMGDRLNRAKYCENRSDLEDEGIIVGTIGTRLVKSNVMEWQEILCSAEQNTPANGYGPNIENSVPKLFFDFYEEKCREFKELTKLKRFLSVKHRNRYRNLKWYLFDNHMYYKRLAISFDTLLVEANYRAKIVNKSAYLHVVGIGLGVWRLAAHQDDVFMDTFADRLELLGKHLYSTSDICLSYMKSSQCGKYKHGDLLPIEGHPLGGIRIHIYKREPHAKLSQTNEDKLLVVSYAWDANALPGNEWWLGSLTTSSDPAAASSTQISEIHNPHINPFVSVSNLMVVTESDVVPLEKYREIVKNQTMIT